MVHIAAGIPLLTVTDGTDILGVIEKCKADTFLLTSNRSITIFKVNILVKLLLLILIIVLCV